ncbi:MAG: helix-turn-helix domain-containing protein [Chitinophagaceae bacterium]|nr:helix-turn-helix domain-containing protein [Chitinophagaceae bacterium]
MSIEKKKEVSILVGNRIRNIRQKRGLTMEQLSYEVGIEYTQLSRIERGIINTSVFQLFMISRALKVDFEEIICGLNSIDFQFD